MTQQAESKSLDFKIITHGSLPERIHTDPARLRQCLINLTNNAIKFTEEGHVYVNISLQDMDNQPYIRFDIEDTGVGIPKDKQDKIFDAFIQADGSTNRKYGGTGLGLTVTKQLTELLGGNAIEIDVKLSKDRVPFLYHDKTINLRLTQKSTIWGNIEDFTFPQLRSLITLVRGEKIPSLREALTYVVEKTNIEFVWLDMKSTKNDIPEVIQIQKDILQRAEELGKKLEIYVGLPTDDKVEHFMSHPDWETTTSLNEFEPDDARRTKSEVWGPRWTLGMQNATVLQMQSEGRKVITWTMDDPDFIKQYMYEGHFNGMVTNYPTLVAYYHYSR
jgi:glycerophosphoryl diester phosphodiesterase